MNNPDFFEMLRAERDSENKKWTVTRLAKEINSNRACVSQVLNNEPGRGGQTRRKLVVVFKDNFVTWPGMLACLGWNEDGSLVNPAPAQPSAFLLARRARQADPQVRPTLVGNVP